MGLNEQQKAVLSRGLGLLSWLVVAAVLGFALGACGPVDEALSAKSYDVVCVSGGIPVMRLTVQRAIRYENSWVFVVDGLQYETNLECILRPHQ